MKFLHLWLYGVSFLMQANYLLAEGKSAWITVSFFSKGLDIVVWDLKRNQIKCDPV